MPVCSSTLNKQTKQKKNLIEGHECKELANDFASQSSQITAAPPQPSEQQLSAVCTAVASSGGFPDRGRKGEEENTRP